MGLFGMFILSMVWLDSNIHLTWQVAAVVCAAFIGEGISNMFKRGK